MEDLKREKGRIGRKEYRRKGRKGCRWDGRKGGKRGRWAGRNNRRIVQGVRDWKGRKGAGIRKEKVRMEERKLRRGRAISKI